MQKIFIIFALLATIFLKIDAQSPYCNLPSCGGATHIDCEMADGAWGSKCPKDKNMLNLAAVLDQIVDRHNDYRNKIAGRFIAGFPAAKRMAYMVWNVTLANFCRKTVRQCEMRHDQCHNTPEYSFAGQNLAYRKYLKTNNILNIDVMLELVDKWYNDEIVKATAADFNVYKGDMSIANVAQMLRDYASRIGCAAAAWEDNTYRTILFCCNYDMGNIYQWPTYYPGKATSKCRTGAHSTYKYLCSANEVYDVNTFWLDAPYMMS